MKKIALVAVLSVLTSPVFAQVNKKPLPLSEETIKVANDKNVITTPSEMVVTEKLPVLKKPVQETNKKIKFPRGMQIGAGISATSGLNGFVGYANKDFESPWFKRLGVRFDFASTAPVKSAINSAIDSVLRDGVDIGDGFSVGAGNLKAKHMGALVDIYPFGDTYFLGGIRLTGGYIAGTTNLNATLTGTVDGAPSDPFEFELNGQAYKYTGNSIDATAGVEWKFSGPYLGTGFDLGLIGGFKIYMDAGLVFSSKAANADIDVSTAGLQQWNSVSNAWDPVNVAILEQNKGIVLRKANDKLGDTKVYPMIKIGFMYRF